MEMSETPQTKSAFVEENDHIDIPTCAAANIRNRLAMEAAAAAAAEGTAGDGEWETQEASEASKENCHLCSTTISFTEAQCNLPPQCVSSGSCEYSWARLHPETYLDPDGNLIANRLPCSGNRCSAVVEIAGPDRTPLTLGSCAVDLANEYFKRNGRALLNTMPLSAPHEEAIEAFDGATEPIGQEL